MSTELKVPAVGESINEVFIGEWYIAEGDWVDVDQEVVGLETDKATFDVPAPTAGVLTGLTKRAGDTAQVGEVIAQIEPGEKPEGATSGKSKKSGKKSSGTASSKTRTKAGAASTDSGDTDGGGSDGGGSGHQTTAHVMPAADRLLRQNDLDADSVRASGPGGRLLKEDVQRHLDGGSNGADPGHAAAAREEKRVPMSPIRRRIGERLVSAQQTAALLTTFNEIDMSAVMDLRQKYKEPFQKKYDIKLGFMSFFVKAVVDALNEYPQVGAQVDGDDLLFQNYCDIGVAIGGGKGLVVPIIRSAERLSFAQIEQTITELAARAQKNEITLEEMQGGNFTITNGGIYGSLLSTPIVNPPQSGVLGMHGIVERPIALNGEVVIRPMMYVALTYDHRVVDGREAVTFLKRIKDVIEEPTRMILEV